MMARQHSKVMTTLQQQMEMEKAKMNTGQQHQFKNHFKNVFN